MAIEGMENIDKIIAELKEAQEILKEANNIAAEVLRDAIQTDLIELVREIFDSEGIDPWTPLNPEYEARKAREFPGKTILRRTDDLYQAYTNVQLAFKEYDIPTHIPYAQYHEDIGPKPPQREVLGQVRRYYRPDNEELSRIFAEALSEQLARVFSR